MNVILFLHDYFGKLDRHGRNTPFGELVSYAMFGHAVLGRILVLGADSIS